MPRSRSTSPTPPRGGTPSSTEPCIYRRCGPRTPTAAPPRVSPTEVEFATKPALAAAMVERAVDAGVPAAWVAGDEVYGADPQLRATVRDHGLGYVMQIACNRQVTLPSGNKVRVDQLPKLVPAKAWQRYSAGAGTKGPRWYSWAWVQLAPEPTRGTSGADDHPDGATGREVAAAGVDQVLIRRNDSTGELAFHLCYAPRPVPLPTLVAVAGQRWRIEESFQAAKTLVGLDQHQVRRWTSWHRWTTLAMLAHAFLTVATAGERDRTVAHPDMIDLTVAEFRRLFVSLLLAITHTIDTLLAWSRWRRQHQSRARECHYRRRQHR